MPNIQHGVRAVLPRRIREHDPDRSPGDSILFLGGWLSPVGFLPDNFIWLLGKMAFILLLFLWFRATFPRYRYDQLMRLGWKVFIPVCNRLALVVGVWMMSP